MKRISESFTERLFRLPPFRLILALIIFQFIVHLPFFSLPPVAQHTWRQVISLAAARNYYQEDPDLLYPRSDTRVSPDDPGYSYQEFPLIYWILGMSYHLTGFGHANSRIFAFFYASLLLVFASLLLKELGVSSQRRRLTLLLMSFSPLYFYYSITLLPNIPALLFFMIAAWLYLKSMRSREFCWWVDLPGIFFLSLAIVTKATWLFYGILFAGIGLREWFRSSYRPALALKLGLWGGSAMVAAALQYRHQFALHLSNPPERQDVITLGPEWIRSFSHFVEVSRSAIGLWFTELTLGHVGMLFFLIGIFLSLRILKKKGEITLNRLFWLLWGLSASIFSLFFFPLYQLHAYYQTHILLPACYLAAMGLEAALMHQRWRKIAVVLICVAPVCTAFRIIPRWISHKNVPDALLSHSETFRQQIPQDELVLIMGDSTPNVFLYYLERKGLVLKHFEGSSAEISALYGKGFRWLLVNTEDGDPGLSRQYLTAEAERDHILLYRLLKPT
ncbi:MAG: glycosyltransferase family 39 protein [Deltaproteobacteria bacterium]|nr:glycosyltransferase family 39 protein [Deltaproteobacteria bacterium]